MYRSLAILAFVLLGVSPAMAVPYAWIPYVYNGASVIAPSGKLEYVYIPFDGAPQSFSRPPSVVPTYCDSNYSCSGLISNDIPPATVNCACGDDLGFSINVKKASKNAPPPGYVPTATSVLLSDANYLLSGPGVTGDTLGKTGFVAYKINGEQVRDSQGIPIFVDPPTGTATQPLYCDFGLGCARFVYQGGNSVNTTAGLPYQTCLCGVGFANTPNPNWLVDVPYVPPAPTPTPTTGTAAGELLASGVDLSQLPDSVLIGGTAVIAVAVALSIVVVLRRMSRNAGNGLHEKMTRLEARMEGRERWRENQRALRAERFSERLGRRG